MNQNQNIKTLKQQLKDRREKANMKKKSIKLIHWFPDLVELRFTAIMWLLF